MVPLTACIETGALAFSWRILGPTLAVGMVLGALLYRRFAPGQDRGLVVSAGELGRVHGVAGSTRPGAAVRNDPQVIAAANRRPACDGVRGSLVQPSRPWPRISNRRVGCDQAIFARASTTPDAPASQ